MLGDPTARRFDGLDAIPDAVIVADGDGLIVLANAHANRLFGYEYGKLVGLTIESLIPKRYRKRHAQLVEGFFAEPSVHPMRTSRELRGLRSDGKEFPMEIAIGPTENGTHTVAVVRDITSLAKMRSRLGESEAESYDLDDVFKDTPIGLCYFDKKLRFLRVNKWLARINGLPVEEHLGRKIADVLPDVALGVESQLRTVLQTGEPILNGLAEVTTPAHPTTTRTYMHNYFPQRSTNGALVGILCVVQDVTEIKRNLEAALAEVKRLKQLQAKNIGLSQQRFAEALGSSVHTLRN